MEEHRALDNRRLPAACVAHPDAPARPPARKKRRRRRGSSSSARAGGGERLREVLDQVEGDIRAGGARRDADVRRRARPRAAAASASARAPLRGGGCIAPGAYPQAAADLGAALELFQTYLLIHDDWMDNDPVRRGAPSVHDPPRAAVTATRSARRPAPRVLAGDMLCALTHEIVGSLDVPAAAPPPPVILAFGRMECEVILGRCTST